MWTFQLKYKYESLIKTSDIKTNFAACKACVKFQKVYTKIETGILPK